MIVSIYTLRFTLLYLKNCGSAPHKKQNKQKQFSVFMCILSEPLNKNNFGQTTAAKCLAFFLCNWEVPLLKLGLETVSHVD